MDVEQLALEHQETKDRSLRNEGRIKKLETESAVLHELAKSVAVMAEQMKTINTSVTTIKNEVEEIKEKPGRRWESLVDKIIWAVAAALIGYVIASIGL